MEHNIQINTVIKSITPTFEYETALSRNLGWFSTDEQNLLKSPFTSCGQSFCNKYAGKYGLKNYFRNKY